MLPARQIGSMSLHLKLDEQEDPVAFEPGLTVRGGGAAVGLLAVAGEQIEGVARAT